MLIGILVYVVGSTVRNFDVSYTRLSVSRFGETQACVETII